MKVFGSNSRPRRSRTVSLPRSFCFAIFSAPPMARFFSRLALSSEIFAGYSSLTGELSADQEISPLAPAVEEATEVALRQPVALVGRSRLPEPVFVLRQRQTGDGHRSSPTIAQTEAELDVGDAVEAELRVEALHRLGVGAAKRHAVALDGVDLRSGILFKLLEGAIASESVGSGHHDGWIRKRVEQWGDGVACELDTGIEQDDHLAHAGLDARVDRHREADRRIERDQAQSLGRAGLQPAGHACIAGVVDDHGLEIGLRMGEHREQPALHVGAPAVDDGQQRDRTGPWLLARLGWSLERLQHAAVGAVEDLPPARAQLFADGVRGREIALPPAHDALGDQLFRLVSIQRPRTAAPYAKGSSAGGCIPWAPNTVQMWARCSVAWFTACATSVPAV